MKYEISDLTNGDIFICDEDESLFAAMIRTGKGSIRYGCEGGGCGVCKIKIISGDTKKFKNMSRAHVSAEEEAEGFALACCIKPLSDIRFEKAPKKNFFNF